MQVTRKIQGYEVLFTTKIQSRSKIVTFYVVGGGSGPCSSWLEAWSEAVENVRLTIMTHEHMALCRAEREAERLARVQKHQEKQRRRANARAR